MTCSSPCAPANIASTSRAVGRRRALQLVRQPARLHALYYPCEREYQGVPADEADATHRMALVYRALGDEQRLRILGLLRGGEFYVQEIVERTGLHQSVLSRTCRS